MVFRKSSCQSSKGSNGHVSILPPSKILKLTYQSEESIRSIWSGWFTKNQPDQSPSGTRRKQNNFLKNGSIILKIPKRWEIELPCSSWALHALFSNPPQLQPQKTWRNVSKHHHLTWNMKNLNELTHKYEHIDLKSQVSGFVCLSESTESPKVQKWENPCCYKVSGCSPVIILHQTPIYDWCG